MNCFTGKPAASTREAAEKAQWSDVKLSANWGWLLGGQAPALSGEIPLPLPDLQPWVSLLLWAGTGWATWLLGPLFGVCQWVAFSTATLEQKRMQGKEKRAEKSGEEGGNGIKARQEGAGSRVALLWVWLLVHPIHYPYYSVPGQMHRRKRC